MASGDSMNAGVSSNTLGKYRLIAELGRGGMAEVYLAIVAGPAGFNKLLVVKCIRPNLAEDPDFLAMFLDEARLAARLNHPNIVQTIEVGHMEGRYFIAMEYLEGQPLNRIQHRVGRQELPLGQHMRILCEVLSGLHHAHELTDYDGTPLDVVHRDTSPHNTFVTYSGQVKVVDFGIAKALNSSAETRTGVLKGKVAYMSPEQARGERVDRRADLYSVGVMLWEALARRRMWKGQGDIVILNHILSNGDTPRPSTLHADVPPRLEEICMRALSRDRDRRHGTALEMLRDLEGGLDELRLPGQVRDAGELVARHFGEERSKLKGIIEEQIASARNLASGDYHGARIPLIGDSTERGSLSGTGPDGSPVSALVMNGSNPSLQTLPASAGSQDAMRLHAGGLGGATPTTGTMAAIEAPAARRPHRGAVVGVAATAVAIAAVAVFFATRSGADAAVESAPQGVTRLAAATEPSVASATKPPGAEEAVTALEVRFKVLPAEAKVFLDGVLVEGQPPVARPVADGSEHELRAEAAGYEPKTRQVVFDRSQTFDLELAPQTTSSLATPPRVVVTALPPPTASPSAATTPPPPPATTEEVLRVGNKTTRPIDEDNPYAKPQ